MDSVIRNNSTFIKDSFFLKFLRIAYLSFSIFLFTFHGSLGFGPITGERIGVLLLGLYWLCFNGGIKIKTNYVSRRVILPVFLVAFFSLLYSFFISYTVWRPIEPITFAFSEFLNFLIVGGLALFFVLNIFKNTDDFMTILFIVSLFQAIIIILKLLVPSFSSFIDNSINSNQYFDYTYLKENGYYGGIFCITSTGSMSLSCGIIACVYRIIKKQAVLFNILCLFAVCFACSLTARTGVLLSLLAVTFLMVFSIFKKNENRKKQNRILLSLVIIFICLVLVIVIFRSGDYLSSLFTRLLNTNLYGLDATFFSAYFQTRPNDIGIPPISIETIVGTGIISGVSNFGTIINVDGGFLRMYCGIEIGRAHV